jgi:mannitol operon repressor
MTTKRMNLDEYKWESFYEEFQSESPRAAVIISGAFLDSLLRDLIASFMIENKKVVDELLGSDKNPETPLSSFGARIKTAFCLGLISNIEYHDLNIVKKMRNKFAHKLHGFTFESEEIVGFCNSLKLPKLLSGGPSESIKSHRRRYILTVSILSSQLAIKILGIQGERRTIPKDVQVAQYVVVPPTKSDSSNAG